MKLTFFWYLLATSIVVTILAEFGQHFKIVAFIWAAILLFIIGITITLRQAYKDGIID